MNTLQRNQSSIAKSVSPMGRVGTLEPMKLTSRMVERYVRVQTQDGKIYYGHLQLSREVHVFEGPPWRTQVLTDLVLPPSSYRFLAPCIPSKIVGIDRNHEPSNTLTKAEPILFLKPPTSIIGTKSSIPYPQSSQYIDAEGELALVIGKRCKGCSPDEAAQFIWGYTIATDVTARDLEARDQQSARAKGFDGFCPLGPWITPTLSFNSGLKTFINEELRQSSNMGQMRFTPHELVSYVSDVMALLPGDIILTGTSIGIGPLKVGDRIRVEVESIGSLENQVVEI